VTRRKDEFLIVISLLVYYLYIIMPGYSPNWNDVECIDQDSHYHTHKIKQAIGIAALSCMNHGCYPKYAGKF